MVISERIVAGHRIKFQDAELEAFLNENDGHTQQMMMVIQKIVFNCLIRLLGNDQVKELTVYATNGKWHRPILIE